jgi:hypothetical protein
MPSGRAATCTSTQTSPSPVKTSSASWTQGRRAPSSQNWQPWHFVVVTGCEQLTGLAKAWEQGGRHIAGSAAAFVLVAA